MAAEGCRWPRRAADGRRGLPMAAAALPMAAGGRRCAAEGRRCVAKGRLRRYRVPTATLLLASL